MSFPAYAQYRETRVEWLARMPSHWRAASLRWLSRRYSGGTPDKNTPEYWENGSIPWLNSGEVNQALITEPSTFISESGFANSSAKWIPAGALVMALAGQGKTKGMVAQLAIRSTCNQSMAAIVPNGEVQPRFLLWWLQSNYQNIRNMAGGDMRDGLNLDLLGEIPCPIPSSGEQAAIAAFLDRETEKIDALIAEQEHLLELLAEKRQAVISHAVTKGLNPDASMKASGVAWLGEVPAHWSLARVKTVCDFTTSGPRGWSERLTEHGALFIQSGDLNDRLGIEFETANRVAVGDDAESARTRLLEGDVVVCITGAKTGKVAVCYGLNEPAYVNQHLCLMRPNGLIDGRFMAFALASTAGQLQLDASQYGLKQGLSLEDVREVWIAFPKVEEQKAILNWLVGQIEEFSALVEEAARAVSLLRERRTAIIAAAVTGQIDVREAA